MYQSQVQHLGNIVHNIFRKTVIYLEKESLKIPPSLSKATIEAELTYRESYARNIFYSSRFKNNSTAMKQTVPLIKILIWYAHHISVT